MKKNRAFFGIVPQMLIAHYCSSLKSSRVIGKRKGCQPALGIQGGKS